MQCPLVSEPLHNVPRENMTITSSALKKVKGASHKGIIRFLTKRKVGQEMKTAQYVFVYGFLWVKYKITHFAIFYNTLFINKVT